MHPRVLVLSLGQGAAGAYNSYFLQLAQDMVAGGQGSSVIRPGWEFNGGWFSWAANGQAAAFVGFWQQIVNTMRSVPGQDFTFEWNPTAGDEGVGNLANYYPGNAYVDYIGLDLYDQAWGSYPGIGIAMEYRPHRALWPELAGFLRRLTGQADHPAGVGARRGTR